MTTTRERVHHSERLETARPRTAREIPREVAGILEDLLSPSSDPLGEGLGAVMRTLNKMCAHMEALTRELKAASRMAARLVDEKRSPDAARRAVSPELGLRAKTGISTREKEILAHLLGGENNREISRELGISEKTVKNHLWKIYRKIGVKSRTQLFHHLICS